MSKIKAQKLSTQNYDCVNFIWLFQQPKTLFLLYQHSVIPTKYSNEFLFYHSWNVYFANEVDGKTLP